MRFDRLRIERYGCFRELELDLPAPSVGAGLHVLLGPNEAGKTTLLTAVRALLYGFPVQSGYNQAFEYKDFRVAASIAFASGERLEVTRRKGSGETLGGMPEAQLAARLAVPESVYASLCAFTLADLARGAELLKSRDARETILGAGLGQGASVGQVREALAREAAELYAARAQKPAINTRIREIEEAERDLREASLDPAVYEAKLLELAQARSEEREAADEAERAGEDARRLRRLAEALPLRRLRDGLLRRAEEIDAGIPTAFPRARADEPARLLAERDRLARELEGAEERLRERTAQIESIVVDDGLLERRGEIQELVSRLAEIEGFERDAPRLEGQLAALRAKVESGLAETRPGWDIAGLERYALEPGRQARVRDLLAAGVALREDRTRLEQSAGDRAKAEREARAALEALGEPDDVECLRALVDEWPERESEAKQLSELERRLAKARDAEARAWAELDPPAPVELADEPDLVLPGEETVRAFEARFRSVDSASEPLRARAESAEESVARLEAELATRFPRELPSLEALAAARERRDVLWQNLRDGSLFEGDDARAFEQAVAEADAIADALLAHAETVARRDQCERDLTAARAALAQQRERLGELADERATVVTEWAALFAAARVSPHPPAAMREWLRAVRHLRSERLDRVRDEALAAMLRRETDAYTEALRRATGSTEARTARLAAVARERVSASVSRERDRGSLSESLARSARERLDDEVEHAHLAQRGAELEAGWRELLAELALDGIPADETARDTIDALRDLRREWLAKSPDLARRASEMRAGTADFAASVRALCEALAPELADRPARSAARDLWDRLEASAGEKARGEEVARARDEAIRDVADRRERLAAAAESLADLLRPAGVADEGELLALCERVGKAKAIRDEAATHEHTLAGIAVQTDPEAFRAELDRAIAEGADAGELAARSEERARAREEASERRGRAHQSIGSLERDIASFDGESRASEAAERAAEARARLAGHVERFAVVTIARTILERELERFRRENQPQVLRRAEELLGLMTGGRYRALRLEEGDAGGIRALRADASDLDAGLGFPELSTGTREQLYLALRLAWVDLRAEASEPLPLVLDDVLVNFDEPRTRSTLGALAEVSRRSQVLFLTCHPRLTELALEAVPSAQVVRLPEPA